MVHGIGQRLEKANLVDDVGAFRQTVTALSEHHLTPHQRNAQRVLFIPCQVYSSVKRNYGMLIVSLVNFFLVLEYKLCKTNYLFPLSLACG